MQGYDELGQEVETTVGNTYQVSFTAEVLGGVATWSRLSTNGDKSDAGGNGADILVYALNGKPIPEPSTWTMMGLGFAGLGYLGYRRREATPLALRRAVWPAAGWLVARSRLRQSSRRRPPSCRG